MFSDGILVLIEGFPMEGMLVGVHCDTHLSSEESREDFVFFLPDLHMIFDAIVDALRS